jgi:hypothetical protein
MLVQTAVPVSARRANVQNWQSRSFSYKPLGQPSFAKVTGESHLTLGDASRFEILLTLGIEQ